MDQDEEWGGKFMLSNLLGVSRLISKWIPPPPEGKAFLVGGLLRDSMLLDYGPSDLLDIDLCLSGDVLKWSERISKHLSCEVVFEPRFKTARFWIKPGRDIHVDIAMARTEVYEKPGSLPIVTPATCLEDLGRRDFSMNAMAWPLEEVGYCQERLIDPFGGREDIVSGILRVLHRNSFRDDPTRIFRGFRLLSRYAFKWESGTQSLLSEAISQKSVLTVSGARIRKEFVRVFLEKDPVDILKRIYLSGLMESIFPKAIWSPSLEGSLLEVVWLVEMLFSGGMSSLLPFNWRSLKEWCHGETFFYLPILKEFSSEEIESGVRFFGLEGKVGIILRDVILKPSVFSGKERHPDDFLRIIHQHVVETGSRYGALMPQSRMDARKNLLSTLNSFSEKVLKSSFVSGEDLLRMGVPGGKRVGEILKAIDERVSEGSITSRKEALEWVRSEMLRT
ncbi:MAG: tRNA nucleotidyltransferase/poly(A) polymerase family protein [Leptospirillum sp.]